MYKSKRIQAFMLAAIMAFLPCCTAFAENMPDVATGNDLPAITEEPPTPTEAATEEPTPTEQPTLAAEAETTPPIETETAETQTTEETTVSPPAPLPAQAGDFVSVTTSTRAFLGVDDTMEALSLGVFVRDAVVQVEVVEQDAESRVWYRVRYLYGDDYANGTLKWTAEGLAYVLAEEIQPTDAQALTVTDYAVATRPAGAARAHRASAMDGFALKNIHGTMGSFTVGQTGVHGSSGKDSEYKQIATLPGKGAICATPHYLNGCPVYCLEHLYPGPGENISGGGKQPTGPYTIVDIDSYMNTPGNSKIIYHESTLHAIAWVLRHTYPFMVLDRSDASNETWSRVAGQFAIREVIKQLEGAQYVRDYWRMNEFYAAANQAPAVYLMYARWLAANGIARASITGEITVTGQSVQQVRNQYIGKMTLTTDADLMRIRKTAGSLTGNTAGADETYYYLNSGDTVQITSSSNGFTVQIESVSSDTEEADFLIGVPDAAIQKVLIPMQGKPYALKSKNVAFKYVIQYGNLTVQKQGKGGKALSGATFQLYDAQKKAVGEPVTTGTDGKATWSHLVYGTYYVVETAAPVGYQLDSTWHEVSVNQQTVLLPMRNTPVNGSIRVVKKAAGEERTLAGAQFELLVKTARGYERAKTEDGEEIPVLTTDANGMATWAGIDYGDYYVHEVMPPEGYQPNDEYVPISVRVQGALSYASVSNEIIRGKLRIQKQDALTKEVLAGAAFTLTRLSAPASHNGVGVGEVVAVLTTDAAGVAEIEKLPWGRYLVAETKVPEHFEAPAFSTEVAITANEQVCELVVDNAPTKGWLRLTKTDRLNGNPIAGVQFDIYERDAYGDALVGSMVTDENGVAVSEPLRKGRYLVREHGATGGYVFEEVTLEATVKRLLQVTAQIGAPRPGEGILHHAEGVDLLPSNIELCSMEITLINVLSRETTMKRLLEPMKKQYDYILIDCMPSLGQLTINALAAADKCGKALAGAAFQLYDAQKKAVGEPVTTRADGKAAWSHLVYGTYYVVETAAPVGYQPDNTWHEVSVNQQTVLLPMRNTPVNGSIRVVKKAAGEERTLAGAQFELLVKTVRGYARAKTEDGEEIPVLTTDANGMATWAGIDYGDYYVHEVMPPEGYLANDEYVPISIRVQGALSYVSISNEIIRGKLRIQKQDALTKEVLAGAAFTLTRLSAPASHNGAGVGEVVATLITDAAGMAEIDDPPWGRYLLTETKAPEHFEVPAFSTEVVITANEQICELVVENKPTKGWLRLTKTDRLNGNPIVGVQFDIYEHDAYGDALVGSMVTDENGVAVSEPLRKGRYLVREHGATAGYVFEEVTLEATVKSDETIELQATNQPVQVRLKIYKRDFEEARKDNSILDTRGDGLLTGAGFRVLAGADITDRQGNVLYAKGDIVASSLITTGDEAAVMTEEL